MIRLTQKLPSSAAHVATLTLPLELRVKSRLRAILDDGREAGVFLNPGTSLQDGDLLASDDGFIVRVQAAVEKVSTVDCTDPLMLARACYHLGNRHVPLQIERNHVRYQQDHVLDGMIESLGLRVTSEEAPFEPEPGAYGHHHSKGAHDH